VRPSGSGAVRDVWSWAIRCVCTVALVSISSPSAATASSWGAVQLLPSPTGGGLGSVSCTSETACVAVGAIAARWNGGRWSELPDPPATGGISCTSRTACIGVGEHYCSCSGHTPRAARWNGREWSRQRVPYTTGVNTVLSAVSCTSASACTAVGYTGLGSLGSDTVFVERFDGRRWSIQSAPTPAWAEHAFRSGVSCVSQTVCTAVGMIDGGPLDQLTRPLAERWNGRQWVVEHTPRPGGTTTTQLNSVSCTSSNACTAVGQADDGTLVERWNGNRWQIQQSPNLGAYTNTLLGVSCASAKVCTAVGATDLDIGSDVSPAQPLAERWDGRQWSLHHVTAPAPAFESSLDAISCAAKNVCVAVGGSNAGPIVEGYS